MAHQPGEGAGLQAGARLAVRAAVGEEPAGDADRGADQQRRGGRTGATERRDEDQGPTGREVVADGRAGAAVGTRADLREQRSHGPAIFTRDRALLRCVPAPVRSVGLRSSTVGRPLHHGRLPRPDGCWTSMKDPEQFDAFYKDARERLLVQTYALTGDLAASRRAVRDAFIVAWHHWRKHSRHDDPETLVRPHAWRLAQRNHTARMWHRDKDISPEVKTILDGLGKLSHDQRRTLVLTQLAAVSMPQMAREVGLPLEVAERELQAAATQLAMAIDMPTHALRTAFETIAASVADTVRWPRATIIRRAGAARRRTHTTIGRPRRRGRGRRDRRRRQRRVGRASDPAPRGGRRPPQRGSHDAAVNRAGGARAGRAARDEPAHRAGLGRGLRRARLDRHPHRRQRGRPRRLRAGRAVPDRALRRSRRRRGARARVQGVDLGQAGAARRDPGRRGLRRRTPCEAHLPHHVAVVRQLHRRARAAARHDDARAGRRRVRAARAPLVEAAGDDLRRGHRAHRALLDDDLRQARRRRQARPCRGRRRARRVGQRPVRPARRRRVRTGEPRPGGTHPAAHRRRPGAALGDRRAAPDRHPAAVGRARERARR